MSPLHALETAAFAAWPSLEHEDLFGWHLRYAQGYTKRANSANATAVAQDLSPAQIAAIEARFTERGLRPIFRLASFAAPEGTDSRLAGLGYQFLDLSLVMRLAGEQLPAPHEAAPFTAAPLTFTDPATWLTAFQQISGKLGPDQAVHLQMLQAIRHPCAFAVQTDAAGKPVCCGLAVLVAGQVGLFDIATHSEHRRQGLAKALCHSLLAWGRERGAQGAYLQVVGANAGAIRLYETMGFRRAYHYWYRVRV
ncbi:MAG TPA: GNAT family N-acetyltransferase [Ideonella sp.]|uniref:GNAT family N-acetyltransferase n=1 Tax=Ideonella sp. TaxID=1929293 RepID=UPI002D17738C|nr:GNAT family N-acetyltransferase [Ideonella sp.]HSI49824.1 GNAT family N-acetyltransferase [Ideonella sp.]